MALACPVSEANNEIGGKLERTWRETESEAKIFFFCVARVTGSPLLSTVAKAAAKLTKEVSREKRTSGEIWLW